MSFIGAAGTATARRGEDAVPNIMYYTIIIIIIICCSKL